MKSINIHEAKNYLSKLVELAAAGEPVTHRKSRKALGEGFGADSTRR